MTAEPLLAVEQLRTQFGALTVVDGVDLTIARGETLGLVGESGCGKSMLALSIARLAGRGARISARRVRFAGRDLLALDERQMQRVRGDRIGFVFQDPMSSLNPLLAVGEQIAEVLRVHRRLSRQAAGARAVELLRLVEMPAAARRASDYPHQLSGGQRQRVMIALALACKPDLLIADEPTTALDVTVQAQVLALLQALQDELGMAILIITHDLGIVSEIADRIAVMYAGRIVESGPAATVLNTPLHPYTRALIAAVPPLDATLDRLPSIEGVVPAPGTFGAGCRFRNRCPLAVARCATDDPGPMPFAPGGTVACWRAAETGPPRAEAAA